MNPFVLEQLKPLLKGKKVLLGVTGSIAAFKAHDIVRGLRDVGAEVRVVLSRGAKRFVTPLTLETLSGNPVLTSMWESDGKGTHHIDLARWADLFLIAPASANTLSKMAQAAADDLLMTEVIAFKGPVWIAPAMNPVMYSHPGVVRNVKRLKRYGYQFVGPDEGEMACGEEGLGRMTEPQAILEAIAGQFYEKPREEKLLITLGPTRAYLDPVRYLTNRSSGKMGAALAWAAVAKGYKVTVVKGPVHVPLPNQAKVVEVKTTLEMAEAVLKRWPKQDVYIGAAAVLDFEPMAIAEQKIKKSTTFKPEFAIATDILKAVGFEKTFGQTVVGFAAETENHLEHGKQKLKAKGCDAVFVNDVSQQDTGFESDFNSGWWVHAKGILPLDRMSKTELAQAILKALAELRSKQIKKPKSFNLSEISPPMGSA